MKARGLETVFAQHSRSNAAAAYKNVTVAAKEAVRDLLVEGVPLDFRPVEKLTGKPAAKALWRTVSSSLAVTPGKQIRKRGLHDNQTNFLSSTLGIVTYNPGKQISTTTCIRLGVRV